MSVLVLSVHDDAAKRIARLLSGGTSTASSGPGPPVHTFEHDGTTINVVGLGGPLTDFEYRPEFRSWRMTDLRALVHAEPRGRLRPSKAKLVETLRALAAEADEVVLATGDGHDAGSVASEAVDVVREARGGLRIRRARFSAFTKESLAAAFDDLADVDGHRAAAKTRRHIDLAWTAVLTRFVALAGNAPRGRYLRLGRVECPTLLLLVAREREIRAFEPEPYWQVVASVGGGTPFDVEHAHGRFDAADAARLAHANAQTAAEATVESVDAVPVTEDAPAPLDTDAFQRLAPHHLGLTVPRAMEVAERLHLDGHITDPYSAGTSYPPDTDVDAVLRGLAKMPEYKDLVAKLGPVRRAEAAAGRSTTADEPPVHPLQPVRTTDLAKDEWDVYDFVARRFLATLAADAAGEEWTIRLAVGSEPFQAAGYRLVRAGWRTFYPFAGRTHVDVRDAARGDTLPVGTVEIVPRETQPPARYDQADVVGMMQELGLGIGSTRPRLMEGLSDRQYVKSPSALEPTETAFAVIDALARHAGIVTKPETAATLEKEIERIAVGTRTMDEVVATSRRMLEEVLDVLEENTDELAGALREALRQRTRVGPCPTCGKDLLIRVARKTRKRFIGCAGWPDCKQTYPLPQAGQVESLATVCDACGAPRMRILKKGRRPWEFCANMDCPTRDEAEGAKGRSDGAPEEESDEKAETATGE